MHEALLSVTFKMSSFLLFNVANVHDPLQSPLQGKSFHSVAILSHEWWKKKKKNTYFSA